MENQLQMRTKKLPFRWIYTVVLIAAAILGGDAAALAQGSDATTSDQKILFVLTSHGVKGNTGKPTGFYLSEASHPWEVLHAAGYTIDFVSPQGGKPPVDGFDLDDAGNLAFWENPEVQTKLSQTMRPEDVNPADYAAIHYVGGHGTMWDFPDNTALAKIAAEIYEANGLVSAVCHGPAGLVNIRLSDGSYLVAGKQVAGFTNEEEHAVGLENVVPFLLEDKLRERGGIYGKAAPWQPYVVSDQRLITGQNPASARGVGEALLKALKAVE